MWSTDVDVPFDPNIQLSLIVPVWNGAERLPATLEALAEFTSTRAMELIIVDDHSNPETSAILMMFCADREGTILLRNARNEGKGYSVAQGVEIARGRHIVFTDADLAYPTTEIAKIEAALGAGADAAIACRTLPDSRYIMSPGFFHYLYTRHLASRAFNRFVRTSLRLAHSDTQAGLKGFTWSAAQTIFSRLTVPGFGFDIECLYIASAHGLRIVEVPVVFRYDDEPTSVRFMKDSTQMVCDVARVRWQGWRNRYA